ncbi:tyrosine-type recombinase/integrase, partial [candidate division KSB1 bacterium]|nr:tyrosine-type recombinase/integrase [candidate division KSB1 bacterium]
MKLSNIVEEYVAHKRALGMNFITEVSVLGAFCRYVGNIPMDSITKDQVQCYLDGDIPVSSYWERKHTVLAGLYRFSLPRGYASVSPLPSHHPRYPPPLTPYIYSLVELKRLLLAVPSVCSLRMPMDAYVFHTVILVLYGACLRISEALNLTMNDIDFDQSMLVVRETKFYKTRFVPIGKDLHNVLCRYVQQRD